MKIVLKKVSPRFNDVITTAHLYTSKAVGKGGLVDTKKATEKYMEVQEIVAIGDTVRDLKVGDKVLIDFNVYATPSYKPAGIDPNKMTTKMIYNIPEIEIDGTSYLYLSDKAIAMRVDEYDVLDDNNNPLN